MSRAAKAGEQLNGVSSREGTALVAFREAPLPRNWWKWAGTVIGPASLAGEVRQRGQQFLDIEELGEFENVEEALALLRQLSLLTLPDGRRISELVTYRGHELWWIHYDALFLRFCLPFTKYRRLLVELSKYSRVYLHAPVYPELFEYFLQAHGCQSVCLAERPFRTILRRFFDVGLSDLLRVALSISFLVMLWFRQARVMVFTSDLLDAPDDFDFRLRRVYEELRERKLGFVEFIRSLHPPRITLRHVWVRRRPVVYSSAIIAFLYGAASRVSSRDRVVGLVLDCLADRSPEERFWGRVSVHFLAQARGARWAIAALVTILRGLGIRVAVIVSASVRTLHELIACKISGIGTVGIQYGATVSSYSVGQFIHEYSGATPMGPDVYGVWSRGWQEYYRKHSRAYHPHQVRVAGHLRPAAKDLLQNVTTRADTDPIRVLFVAEPLVEPREAFPYLQALCGQPDFRVFVKTRPMIEDPFECWLRLHVPEVLREVDILRGDMHEAIAKCDVIVGSYSTGVLEGLLQLKPIVFFNTVKWGDHFGIRGLTERRCLFAENPEGVVDCVRECIRIPHRILVDLRDHFFGDPTRDGGRWVVDQVDHYLRYGSFLDR